MNYSADDIWTAARTVYGEARGETYAGKVAVAHVILNRAAVAKAYKLRTGKPRPNFGDGSLTAACLDPYEFSCWNASDPNRAKLEAMALPACFGDAAFRDCLAAVFDATSGRAPDRTVTSTHYHVVGLSPAWAKGETPVCTIGRHTFYNTVR
jgi:N-acetylmuramoyl-L-alanine amidase